MTDRPRMMRQSQKPKPGIVHLGPGAFCRAFNAVYTQDAIDAKGGDWGIIAVSLRSPTARDQLQPQDGAFTSVTLGADQTDYRAIETISEVLVAPESPETVLERMTDPAIRIVSLTITEKGYCYEPATGKLNPEHPDIAHDLEHPQTPRSAPGFIVEALARRKETGTKPFTVLSCDNLPSNGALTRNIILEMAGARDAGLAEWISENVRFPATMVDRITPATTQDDIERLAERQGYWDPACVQHEPFRQWVIEDDFVEGARPYWEAGGAQLVKDVDAHETMKLRCLNGTHSALAYLGYLAGYETIAQTIADPVYEGYCKRLMRNEIIPTVQQPEGEDLHVYCDRLLERYRNPAIKHRTWQIAMDGSQKLPQRLLGTIADNLSAGRNISCLALAVAGWMRYVGAVDETGKPIDVRDPMADTLRKTSKNAEAPEEKVAALLKVTEIFEAELAQNTEFRTQVTNAYASLIATGSRGAVERLA